MSYLDRWRTPSVRGVPFEQTARDRTFGRRGDTNEFMHKDEPEGSDLGRKARGWSIDAYVHGDDYDIWRDRLLKALEAPGSCQFVDRFGGVWKVKVIGGSVKEGIDKQGVAFFHFNLEEWGKQQSSKTSKLDTVAGLTDAITTHKSKLMDFFTGSMDLETVSGYVYDAMESNLTSLGGLSSNSLLQENIGNATASLRSGNIESFGNSLWDLGKASTDLELDFTSIEIVQGADALKAANNQKVMNTTLRNGALAGKIDLLEGLAFSSRRDALEERSDFLSEISTEMGIAGGADVDASDEVFFSLQNLQEKIGNHFDVIVDPLPDVKQVTASTQKPLALVALEEYGDASRVDDVMARNNILHPLFPEEGDGLELLNR